MRVAKESLPFVALLGLAALVAALALHPAAALVFLLPLLFTLWFFRDPERVPPADPRVLVSPADGRVVRAEPDGVSVFMNVLDVHVCRSPLAGRLVAVEHVPGRFMAAWRDAASEQNERATLRMAGENTSLTVTLVAGLVARRIVLWVEAGRQLERGQRLGLIRFGSRVDVGLPPGFAPAVTAGERVRAGLTVIAAARPSGEDR
jgi:phosphatidylserine decarboxylase